MEKDLFEDFTHLKWVKWTKRQPENEGSMFIRYNGKNAGNILFVCNRILKVDDWIWKYSMENNIPKYTSDQLEFIKDLYWLEEIIDINKFHEYRNKHEVVL